MTNPDPPYPPHPPVPPEPLVWKTSTKCDTGSCVVVAFDGDKVLVRDSKLGDDSPVIEYTRDEWRAVLDILRKVATPWLAAAALRGVEPLDSGGVCWLPPKLGRHMHFDADEWDAFVAAARDGEFDHAG